MKKIAIIGLSGNSLFYEMDHLPKEGESIKAFNLHTEVGGKGFNQALAAKRQGLDVYYLSALGSDNTLKECEDLFKKENINAFFKIKDIPSASASILKDKSGRNEVIVYEGANKLLDLNDLASFKKYIIEADGLLVTYEVPYEVLKEAIKIAKENGVKIILNPAPFVYDDISLLKDADLITPNETETIQMFKMDKLDLDKALKEKNKMGLSTLVITMGDKGCAIIDDTITIIDASLAKVVDTTGAGDVFNASLVSELLDGKDLIEACKYANKIASLSVSKKYVLDAIPRRK